jgi:ABC-type multidrug transport system fused ATPase/permease subunit
MMLGEQRPALSWLGKQLRRHWRAYAWSGALASLTSALGIVDPLVLKWLIDKILPRRSITLLGVAVVVWFMTSILRYGALHWSSLHAFSTSQRLALHLRVFLIRKWNLLSPLYHDKIGPGDKLHRIEHDVDQVANMAGPMLAQLGTLLLTLGMTFAALAWIDIRVTVIAAVSGAVYVVVRRSFRFSFTTAADELQRRASDRMSFLQEHLGAQLEVQLLEAERGQLRAIVKREVARIRADKRLRSGQVVVALSSTILLTSASAILLSLGGLKVINGALSVGALVASLSYLARIFDPLTGVVDISSNCARLLASVNRLREVPELSARTDSKLSTSPASRFRGHLSISVKSFSYESSMSVLENVCLDIEPGEKIAIVGPSGSGKSTLAKLLAGVYTGPLLELRLDGVPAQFLSRACLRSTIAYVPQDTTIFDRSLHDNLKMAWPTATDSELRHVMRTVRLEETLQHSPQSWHQNLGVIGKRLSGGERQRLALARALLRHPSILILDEVTSALDPVTENEVLSNLATEYSSITLVIISHRLRAINWVDKIVMLKNGRIVEQGPPQELLRHSELYHRFSMIDGAAMPCT